MGLTLVVNMPEQEEPDSKNAIDKHKRCWNSVLANSDAVTEKKLQWPPISSIFNQVFTADAMAKLFVQTDLSSDEPLLCAHGCACKVRLDWFPGVSERYTGLFAKGSIEGIMRLASAIERPSNWIKGSSLSMPLLWAMGKKLKNAVLFPTVAIKVFREGDRPSGNLLFMGSKVGQREESFFAHGVATKCTEKINMVLRPIMSQFRYYSKYPLSSGISNFAAVDVGKPRFPWALCLVPRLPSGGVSSATPDEFRNGTMPAFLKELLSVKPGTVLYDIFACPSPAAAPITEMIERIGYITTLSQMKVSSTSCGGCPFSQGAKVSSYGTSSASKGRLFFQHQKKEEDYAYHPEWIPQLQTKCTVRNSDGKDITGTVGHLCGWKLFKRHVATGKFVDLESMGQDRKEIVIEE